jgi:hypothetical protein
MLLEKLVDTSVRGFLYDNRGTVPEAVLAGGAHFALWAQERFELPVAFTERGCRDAISRLLAARRDSLDSDERSETL